MNTYPKILRNRMARVSGHLGKVKDMVDNGEDFASVMMQLSAVRASLISISNALVKDALQTSLVEAVETGDQERIDELNEIIIRYV